MTWTPDEIALKGCRPFGQADMRNTVRINRALFTVVASLVLLEVALIRAFFKWILTHSKR
jgi:hypothetical protein